MVGIHNFGKHVDVLLERSLNDKHEVDFFWIFLKKILAQNAVLTKTVLIMYVLLTNVQTVVPPLNQNSYQIRTTKELKPYAKLRDLTNK